MEMIKIPPGEYMPTLLNRGHGRQTDPAPLIQRQNPTGLTIHKHPLPGPEHVGCTGHPDTCTTSARETSRGEAALPAAIGEGAGGPEGGPTAPDRMEDRIGALDVQIGVLLAGERGAWQVFGCAISG